MSFKKSKKCTDSKNFCVRSKSFFNVRVLERSKLVFVVRLESKKRMYFLCCAGIKSSRNIKRNEFWQSYSTLGIRARGFNSFRSTNGYGIPRSLKFSYESVSALSKTN